MFRMMNLVSSKKKDLLLWIIRNKFLSVLKTYGKEKIFSLSQTPVFFQFIQNEAILTKIQLFLFLLSKESKLLIKSIKMKWKSEMD